MKKIIIALVAVLLIGVGVFYYFNSKKAPIVEVPVPVVATATKDTTPKPVVKAPVDTTKTILGASSEKRDITAYHFGTGTKEVMFVGGIHGGYEWNTSLVAYELMDYLKANPSTIPTDVKVTVIPVLNPDGLNKVVGTTAKFTKADVSTSDEVVISGRFNGNGVDLNRNFDCDWQTKGIWQNTEVSGGSAAFSEPESQAVKNYVDTHKPVAVIAWYSSANGVFSSSCHNGVLPETTALTNLYAAASKYPAYASYDFYKLTGDMMNWLAKEKIPAISVLLTTHQDTEWDKNLAGIKAVLNHYSK